MFTQSLVGDEFIGAEAVVQFHHLHVLWRHPRRRVRLLSSHFAHVIANLRDK